MKNPNRTTIAVTTEVNRELDKLILDERFLSKSDKIKTLINTRLERVEQETKLQNENARLQNETERLQAENARLKNETERLDLLNEHIDLLKAEIQRLRQEAQQKSEDEKSAIAKKLLDIPTAHNPFNRMPNSKLFKTLQHGSAEEKARRALLAILEWNLSQKDETTMVFPSNAAIRRVSGCNGSVIKRVLNDNINSIPDVAKKTLKVNTRITKAIRELMLEDKLPSGIPGETSEGKSTSDNTAIETYDDGKSTATKLNRDEAIKSIAVAAVTSLEAIVFDYSLDSTEEGNNALVDLGGRVQEVIKDAFDSLMGLVDTIPNRSVHSLRAYRTAYLSEFENIGHSQPTIQIAGMDFWEFVSQKMRSYFFKNAPTPLVQYSKNLDERASQVKNVYGMPLIKWAIETLDKEAVNGEPIDWTDVALAITVLTGRRRAEILGSASFEYIDDNWVLFYGKTKGHPLLGQENEKPKPEKLLTLGASSRRVIRGLDIVRNALPFQGSDYDGSYRSIKKLAKTIHNNMAANKYADKCRQVMTRLLADDESTLTIAIDGSDKSLATPHRLREIYACIAWRRWQVIDPSKQNVKPGILIPQTLHDGKGVRDNYDASFEILDADIIAQIPKD
ncbi:protelomerase family protein [Limnospira platensis]|uniref:protelomerase family protein n=1 Tax=Limnospira platensis TaxID=118562 RepID=UPI003D700343